MGVALALVAIINTNKIIYEIRTLASGVLVENDSQEQWAAPLITWGLSAGELPGQCWSRRSAQPSEADRKFLHHTGQECIKKLIFYSL